MPATTTRGYPYPVGVDPIDAAGDLERLALAIDTDVAAVATSGGSIVALDAWPVGSIFIGVTATNPASLLGGGTWAAFATGRMLIGVDTADTTMNTPEKTGGAKTVSLVAGNMPAHTHTMSHTHTINHTHASTASAGGHGHTASGNGLQWWCNSSTGSTHDVATVGTNDSVLSNVDSGGAHTHTIPAFSGNSGASSTPNTGTYGSSPAAAFSIFSPFITTYMWKRTA